MLGHRLVRHFAKQQRVAAVLRPGTRPERLHRVLSDAHVIQIPELNAGAVERLLDDVGPQVVINAAGLIKQRPNASDAVAMIEANAVLPHRLAAACRSRRIRLIHVSSDCVFSGQRGNYAETDVTDADDLYGRSKALGEPTGDGCLSLRTSIIGPEIGSAFGLLEWFRTRRGTTADGFAGVIFPGLPTIEVARVIDKVIHQHPALSGLYHLGATPISKHELLDLINRRLDLRVTLRRVEHPKSDRSLDYSKFVAATGYAPVSWPELIDRMARDEEEELSAAPRGVSA